MPWMQWKGYTYFFVKGNQVLEHSNTSLSNHLNDKTKSKKARPQQVLTKKKDATIVTWVLNI
jgi:hypothetical protein